MGEWTVRRANREDLNRLAVVGSATFLETFAGLLAGSSIVAHCTTEHSVLAYKRLLGDGALWLAELNDGRAPIGYAALTPPKLPGHQTDGSELELKRIYLLSPFQGRGIGAELLGAVIDEARRQSAVSLSLAVFISNKRAIDFYRQNGFADRGSRRFFIGDREYEDLILSRPL